MRNQHKNETARWGRAVSKSGILHSSQLHFTTPRAICQYLPGGAL